MTDTQLQLAIAKMLPGKIKILGEGLPRQAFYWYDMILEIRDTEWEHIVRLVEEELTAIQAINYGQLLFDSIPDDNDETAGQAKYHRWHASWQRATAILKVRGS